MKKYIPIVVVAVVALIVGGIIFFKKASSPASTAKIVPTITPAVQMLTPDQAPVVSLKFSADAHYVTVSISNIKADQVEYNLIYDATVKGNSINTGVNATAKLDGKTEYSKQQLLGSESSGHFTYHANIKNAMMELTLRDVSGRSVYTATYPFEVSPGKAINLVPSE